MPERLDRCSLLVLPPYLECFSRFSFLSPPTHLSRSLSSLTLPSRTLSSSTCVPMTAFERHLAALQFSRDRSTIS